VDSITHALLAAFVFYAAGFPALIPFAILGAVILDADILFFFFSSGRPSRYMFIHGGASHSIVGSTVMAVSAFVLAILAISLLGLVIPWTTENVFLPAAFGAVLGGAWLHLVLDWLATPGIPLAWPFKDTKYTLGVFAGPSPVMLAVSIAFILLVATGLTSPLSIMYYGLFFLAYFAVWAGLRGYVAHKIPGDVYPTMHPLRWLVIRHEQGTWSSCFIQLGRKGQLNMNSWPEYSNTGPGELSGIDSVPEVKRVRYHSNFTVAEKNEETIIIRDPLREARILRYPPYYMRVVLEKGDNGTWTVDNQDHAGYNDGT